MYKAIREAADKLGMSDAEICRRANVNPASMTRIRRRGGNLSFANAARVADVLGIPLSALIDGRQK